MAEARARNAPKGKRKKTKKARSLWGRMFLVMMVISVLQLFTFLAVLFVGGEFAFIRKYAYNSFIEKNANRKSYVENLLVSKTGNVYECAGNINELMAKKGYTAADISSDKEADRCIIDGSAEYLINLLRQDQVNDAFIILSSGSLYSTEDTVKLCGMYIRDQDPSQNDMSANEDLLMEMGSADIAARLGIVLDYEWAGHLDATDNSDGRLDFYFKAVETAENTQKTAAYELGMWSPFSRISRSAAMSMKFTVPLRDKNGDVYGVVGIGLTEKLILDGLPPAEAFGGDICYILGADLNSAGEYSVLLHSGPIYNRLVNGNTQFAKLHRIEGDIYDFNYGSNIASVGNIQEMTLYNSASPFRTQKWAFIAIGDRNSIMGIYTGLVKMFIISSAVSMVISVIGSVILNRRTTAPVKNMITALSRPADSKGIVRLESSNIIEIDMLAKAIVRLQMDVKENASRVSRIIGMMDMGIGVFMYDLSEKTVFIGESLVKLLEFTELPEGEDAVISFDDFKEYLSRIDKRGTVCADGVFTGKKTKSDIELMYMPTPTSEEVWFRFSLSRDKSSVTGLVQDISGMVREKRRIEYERDYDVITGLLNRRAYMARLGKLFAEPEKLGVAAMIMIDLDNLKYVNDTYGHDFGDDYIRQAAKVFRNFADYSSVIARLSGDEFNIFLYGFGSKDEVRAAVKRVSDILSRSYCLLEDGTHYRIRASGGLSWYPDDSDNCEQLIRYADFAMYTIKHTTKGSFAEFDLSAYRKDSILMTGIEELNRIIEEERVRFAFQTIVSAKTGEIYGYELLMRPQSDIIKAPLDLIRLAKSCSKLYAIERLTWLKGLETFAAKIKAKRIPADCKVFINSLSNCIINKFDLDMIEKDYAPLLGNIMLEVLESESENEEYMQEKQGLVKKWGAKLALDDFGSGYNNEMLFLKLSPDLIKIDRSIISGCDTDPGKASIIRSLVAMAKDKNASALAEGVETEGELNVCISCGVDLIQGYYVSYPKFDPEPVSSDVVESIQQAGGRRVAAPTSWRRVAAATSRRK